MNTYNSGKSSCLEFRIILILKRKLKRRLYSLMIWKLNLLHIINAKVQNDYLETYFLQFFQSNGIKISFISQLNIILAFI